MFVRYPFAHIAQTCTMIFSIILMVQMKKIMSIFNNFLVEVGFIELGLITLEKTKNYALIFIIISLIMGVLILLKTPTFNVIGILIISTIGLFLGYFYTAPIKVSL